jgi:hypothetical protein
VSGFEQKTKKDLKAVGEAGFSLTPPGKVYETIKLGVDAISNSSPLTYLYMFIFKKLNIVENNNAEIKQFSLHKEFTGCITKNILETMKKQL